MGTFQNVNKPIPHGLTIAFVLAVVMFGAVWLAINRVSSDADQWAIQQANAEYNF